MASLAYTQAIRILEIAAMTRALIFTLLLLASSLADADLRQTVKCREIAFSQSVESQDLAVFRSLVDADARFLGSTVATGVDEIAARWSVFFSADGPSIKWRPQFIEVLNDGKLALTRGPYRMLTTDDDGAVTEHWGSFNSVWRLGNDGQWRVVFDSGDDADEPPAEEIRELIDAPDDCDTPPVNSAPE